MADVNYIVKEHTVPCQHIRGYYRSTASSQEEELQLAVKQYIPKSNTQPQQGDVTIIAAHCAGMFKEVYEPFFADLIALTERPDSKFHIRAIWIADVATHGQSSVLNEGKLGIDFSWDDHARDLLHLTNVFRDEMVRPVVGFGHSAGATMILRVAAMHPRLFTSVLAVEPAVSKEYSEVMNYAPTHFFSNRKDVWSSKEEAFEETKKMGMQRYWNPRVLERWLDHGFRQLPTLEHPRQTNAVTLSTTKHHATRGYARAVHPQPGKPLKEHTVDRRTHPDISTTDLQRLKQPAYAPTSVAGYRDMPYLLPSCLLVYGEKISTAASRLDNRAAMIPQIGTGIGGSGGIAAGKVKEVVIPGGSHFVPFEQTEAVAGACHEWLQVQLPRWFEDERISQAEWESRGDLRDKATLDRDWMWWVNETYGKPRKSKI